MASVIVTNHPAFTDFFCRGFFTAERADDDCRLVNEIDFLWGRSGTGWIKGRDF